jgi:hypothetical protein
MGGQIMTPSALRAIAIALLLVSVTLTILRMTGVTTWDLGAGRPVILIIAIIFLIMARRKTIKG